MADDIDIGVIHRSQLIRDGISDLLARQPGLRIVGRFESAQDVLDHPPDGDHILLYDLEANKRDGPVLMAALRQVSGTKILIFGVSDDDEAIIDCVRAGASGCILKDASLDDLLAAIHSLAIGAPPASPRVITTLFSYVARLRAGDDQLPPPPLTRREEQILRLIADGLSNKEIAQRLYLQPQTVKNYVHLVLQKMNLKTRLEVIRSLRTPHR